MRLKYKDKYTTHNFRAAFNRISHKNIDEYILSSCLADIEK